MKKIKLTIIIPHYNTPVLLKKLLSTIPSNKNIEVIVIDDKSEDKHIDYIKELQKDIEFILFTNNTLKKGPGIARNIGLEHAKGEWVLFADADDYFTEIFYESISKYFNNENDVVFFYPTSVYLDTGEMAERHMNFMKILDKYKSNHSLENELYLRYSLPSPVCKMIKNNFILENKIKFDETLIAEDVMFATKLGCFMKRFVVDESIIYTITRNFGSSTTNLSRGAFNDRLTVKIHYAHFLKNNLTKKEVNIMNISFTGWLFTSSRYGIFELIKTFLLLKKEKVKIWDIRILNIQFISRKLLNRYYQVEHNKKYYVKD